MTEIKGKYNTAKIFTDNLEPSAEGLIHAFCNQPITEGSCIRIMPDVHVGMCASAHTEATAGSTYG